MQKAISCQNKSVLTIAGSDSGGEAGIQADLRVITSLGLHGATVITCLTAQNYREVTGVMPATSEIVRKQIKAVCSGLNIGAVKTGMLYSEGVIRTVSAELVKMEKIKLVVDPVMISTSGSRLLKDGAIKALQSKLFPLASLITPNRMEAECLSGMRISSEADQIRCADKLNVMYGRPFLVKGGHMGGRFAVDVLCDGHCVRIFRTKRIGAVKTHGTGCTFSAAIASYLALGDGLEIAITRAKRFVSDAIRQARDIGGHKALHY